MNTGLCARRERSKCARGAVFSHEHASTNFHRYWDSLSLGHVVKAPPPTAGNGLEYMETGQTARKKLDYFRQHKLTAQQIPEHSRKKGQTARRLEKDQHLGKRRKPARKIRETGAQTRESD